MNSNTFAQRRPNSFFKEGRNVSIKERMNISYACARFGLNLQTQNQTTATAVEVDEQIDRL